MPDATILNLKNSLTITWGDKQQTLICPPRNALKTLRTLFVELQSYWIEYGFSTGDLLADDRAWDLMQRISELFPRQDNPALRGFDVEALQTDPEQIEQLFLTQDKTEISAYRSTEDLLVLNFFIDVFKGCRILEFCRFEPRLIVQDAHASWKQRRDAALEADLPKPDLEADLPKPDPGSEPAAVPPKHRKAS